MAQLECRGPCRNSAKQSYLPWISTNGSLQIRERYHNTMTEASPYACRRWIQAGWRYVLRVCPIGPTRRGYLVLSFRRYQRFDQWLHPSYLPLKSLLHAIAELLSYLSWLSGGNTSCQTPRTGVIYGPWFHNYWLDCHETWQTWSRGVNFEV